MAISSELSRTIKKNNIFLMVREIEHGIGTGSDVFLVEGGGIFFRIIDHPDHILKKLDKQEMDHG